MSCPVRSIQETASGVRCLQTGAECEDSCQQKVERIQVRLRSPGNKEAGVPEQIQKGSLMKNIGRRCAEAILERVGQGEIKKELYNLELTRQSLHQWEKGKYTPNAKVLRRMALAGYDVMYILTGERKNNA